MNSEIPVILLAGGRGARFDSESQVKPKPMIEVAGKPMLQHIIDGFVAQGFREFYVATGYLGNSIDCYFSATCWQRSYVPGSHLFLVPDDLAHRYTVHCIDTGEDSHTGERLYRLQNYIGDRRFILTYGDGLSDVQMSDVIEVHESYGPKTIITVTAVNPPGRFGVMRFGSEHYHDGNGIISFDEKPATDQWINGGFMVVEPEFISKYIEDDFGSYQLESEAMMAAALHGRMIGHRHASYWRCIDTRRDLEQVEQDVLYNHGNMPWLQKGKCNE